MYYKFFSAQNKDKMWDVGPNWGHIGVDSLGSAGFMASFGAKQLGDLKGQYANLTASPRSIWGISENKNLLTDLVSVDTNSCDQN